MSLAKASRGDSDKKGALLNVRVKEYLPVPEG